MAAELKEKHATCFMAVLIGAFMLLRERGYIKAPRPEERAASFTAAGLVPRSSSGPHTHM